MKQRSPLAACLLSLFIPFYILYWLFVTGKDMEGRGAKVPPFWWLFAPFVAYFLVIMLMFTLRAAVPVDSAARAVFNIVSLLLGLVLVVSMIILPILYYYRFSAAAETVTAGKVSKVVGFVLFLFVAPASVFIIQDGLNNGAAPDTVAASAPAPVYPSAPEQSSPVPVEPGSTPPAPPVDTTPQNPVQ